MQTGKLTLDWDGEGGFLGKITFSLRFTELKKKRNNQGRKKGLEGSARKECL